MTKDRTKQYLIYYRRGFCTSILSKQVYIAGGPKEAAEAFKANMPSDNKWVEIYELVPVLRNVSLGQ